LPSLYRLVIEDRYPFVPGIKGHAANLEIVLLWTL
jgi:hypothetical protein